MQEFITQRTLDVRACVCAHARVQNTKALAVNCSDPPPSTGTMDAELCSRHGFCHCIERSKLALQNSTSHATEKCMQVTKTAERHQQYMYQITTAQAGVHVSFFFIRRRTATAQGKPILVPTQRAELLASAAFNESSKALCYAEVGK